MLIKIVLSPLAFIFYLVVCLRNWLFEKRILTSQGIAPRVVSIGNIAMGGVGKTPIVLSLVDKVHASGKKAAISLRGYKGDVPASGVWAEGGDIFTLSDGEKVSHGIFLGDEASLYVRQLPHIPVLVGSNRFKVAKDFLKLAADPPEVLFMDDGFQHRWLQRDHDVVVIPVGQDNFSVFPLGLNREAVSSLCRASSIIWMHSNTASFEGKHQNPRVPLEIIGGKPSVHCKRVVTDVRGVNSGRMELKKDSQYILVSALGNNAQVAATLLEAGYLAPSQDIFLRDHHKFERRHASAIANANIFVVTTWKDFLRQPDFFEQLDQPVFVIDLSVIWSEDPLVTLHLGK